MQRSMALGLGMLIAVAVGGSFSLKSMASSTQGIAGADSAYYDSTLFLINLAELPSPAEQSVIAHNGQTNVIYTSEGQAPGGGEFHEVIDAVPADGMNPLWREEEIIFNAGYTPHQFYSDDQINDAVQSGEIHLNITDEIYRCSVMGPVR